LLSETKTIFYWSKKVAEVQIILEPYQPPLGAGEASEGCVDAL